MYAWYRSAAVCYAFLIDLSPPTSRLNEEEFRNSLWFTRGWTLQELLAPQEVVFYSQEWVELGRRTELAELLSDITGIETRFLLGDDLSVASAAKKMSWAAHRSTSRTEDVAYCLMGLFDVNMPLLYGEGKKAFVRLQEEIARVTGDHSVFAWGRPFRLTQFLNQEPSQTGLQDNATTDEDLLSEDEPMLGLFAESPRAFENSSRVKRLPGFQGIGVPPTFFGTGVRIGLPIVSEYLTNSDDTRFPWLKEASIALLGCRIEREHQSLLGLLLQPWGKRFFGRSRNLILITTYPNIISPEDPYMERFVQTVVIKAPTPAEDALSVLFLQIRLSSEEQFAKLKGSVRGSSTAKWDNADHVMKFDYRDPFALSLEFRTEQETVVLVVKKAVSHDLARELAGVPGFAETAVYKELCEGENCRGFLIFQQKADGVDSVTPSDSLRDLEASSKKLCPASETEDSPQFPNVQWVKWKENSAIEFTTAGGIFDMQWTHHHNMTDWRDERYTIVSLSLSYHKL